MGPPMRIQQLHVTANSKRGVCPSESWGDYREVATVLGGPREACRIRDADTGAKEWPPPWCAPRQQRSRAGTHGQCHEERVPRATARWGQRGQQAACSHHGAKGGLDPSLTVLAHSHQQGSREFPEATSAPSAPSTCLYSARLRERPCEGTMHVVDPNLSLQYCTEVCGGVGKQGGKWPKERCAPPGGRLLSPPAKIESAAFQPKPTPCCECVTPTFAALLCYEAAVTQEQALKEATSAWQYFPHYLLQCRPCGRNDLRHQGSNHKSIKSNCSAGISLPQSKQRQNQARRAPPSSHLPATAAKTRRDLLQQPCSLRAGNPSVGVEGPVPALGKHPF
ncbi:hypothetical protein NDU88_005769 [Pleurodeles waltl]|uniref:Uncharacterized protein n=1 Tax=Pleurodeles waltl TaxID=8319 RepID=A0AAV7WDM9_PLEWA|nr:hypothetical protein NDU88_005769 [Pleurodeles waltl]